VHWRGGGTRVIVFNIYWGRSGHIHTELKNKHTDNMWFIFNLGEYILFTKESTTSFFLVIGVISLLTSVDIKEKGTYLSMSAETGADTNVRHLQAHVPC
jgi:hypothetical protein